MSLYQHFRQEEYPFIERALEWISQVDQTHRERLTDFLDPRQVYILNSLIAKNPHLSCSVFGGYEEAERCRVILHQSYYIPEPDDFALSVIQVTSPQAQFQKLKHKDYLGALLGAGLKRSKFGDILVHQESGQIILAKEIADYMRIHFGQIHRVQVIPEEIPLSQIVPIREDWKRVTITVPSSRADVVVGDVFRLSRAKALIPIKAGHLKINWMPVDSPSFSIREGDMVSLRGYGRFKVFKEDGITKKGNIRLDIGVLQS
ncbi:RNA-binding protein [Ammoniphilus resinae]|uniref:RNA-binding protein YlmH n=1 Tax=Ammoniphilus resinae TaxID=861532 RepID=A0ABS4GK97_9BACL|nr:YlmH/Sll1252 family protein [Ammoniphilus resinae]MBP1930676.1 RNA-binding protein YlmH [Ammoniphilus resinae]